MQCPVCSENLTEVTVAGVPIDVCDGGCGGMWFDWFELQKFDEKHEISDDQIFDILNDGGNATGKSQEMRNCPRCKDVVMSEHFWSVKKEVKVDECPQCGGFWLDTGELQKIRELFATEEQRHQAGIDGFRDKYGPELERMEAENQAKLDAVLEVTNKYKFLCPSHFIGNSEDWGVF
jgi:uncharacterized protein